MEEETKTNKKKELILMLKEFFINNSQFREERKNYFLSRRKLKKKNTQIPLKLYLVTKKFYKDYKFYKMFCKHLRKLAFEKGLEPYFLTLTKEFSLESMNTYGAIDYIKEIAKIYRQALREIIREFQRNYDVLFISVVEFNDDLFFHLHVIVFINLLFENKFLKILENKVELFGLGYEKKFEKIDIEENDKNLEKKCEYLLKSLKKAAKHFEYAYLLDGAINVLKYKLVTHSKTNLNKKMYFKLLPHVVNRKKFKDTKYRQKDEKFLDIYEYLLKNIKIKIFSKIPGKNSLKKVLKTYKKHKIFVFQEKKEVEKSDEFVELQNLMLVKKILSCKNKEKLLKDIDSYINSYIDSLKNFFSKKILITFRWKFNALKDVLEKGGVKKFKSRLESILYKKYIYTTRTVIYMKTKRKKIEKVYDSKDFQWKIKTN